MLNLSAFLAPLPRQCSAAEMNEGLRFIGHCCLNVASAFTRTLKLRRTNVTFCHMVLTGSLFPPPPSVLPSCFDPPNPPSLPPSLPPCLPTSFLPRRSLSASQHIPPPGGEGCLIRASSNLPSLLSLSLALSPCFLSAGGSLSIRRSRTQAVSITYRQARVQR